MTSKHFARTLIFGASSLALVACGSDSNPSEEVLSPLDDVNPTADAGGGVVTPAPSAPVTDDGATGSPADDAPVTPPPAVTPPPVVTPTSTPTAPPQVVVTPEPPPEVVVTPDPAPAPAPEVVVTPDPAPAPAPEVVVTPDPAPAPAPEVVVTPDPAPAPEAAPAPTDDGTTDTDADDGGNAPTTPPAIELPTGITGSTIIPATHGPIASVDFDFDDPFGADIERSVPQPQGAIPTPPGRLRLNLLSNDWIEIDWTPSADDGEVVEYRIYRDGEQLYTVRGDQTHPQSGSRNEISKFWETTSFIDCNFTRFGGPNDPLHRCVDNAPQPGVEYVWTVTAVDNDGNESEPSNSLTARLYSNDGGSPVALYSDIFLDGDDIFPFATNFSRTENFLDQFVQVFADEFNEPELDLTKWNTELVWTDEVIINGEQQIFVNSSDPDNQIDYDPFRLTGDSLVIEGIPTRPGDSEFFPDACFEEQTPARCQFLSGAIASHDKFGFTYGYVEGRIRVSDNTGGLSSFYLFHRFGGTGNGFHSPEIDILEYLGDNPFGDEDAFQTYHYSDPVTGLTKSSPTMNYENPTGALFSDDFHTYSVLWEPGLSIWYIDGQEIRRISGPQIGRQQMNIVAYLVTGSEWAPTPTGNFPLQMEIDYIRAYQRPAYICNNNLTLAAFNNDQGACQAQLNP